MYGVVNHFHLRVPEAIRRDRYAFGDRLPGASLTRALSHAGRRPSFAAGSPLPASDVP